jgi:hypothetical protein
MVTQSRAQPPIHNHSHTAHIHIDFSEFIVEHHLKHAFSKRGKYPINQEARAYSLGNVAKSGTHFPACVGHGITFIVSTRCCYGALVGRGALQRHPFSMPVNPPFG